MRSIAVAHLAGLMCVSACTGDVLGDGDRGVPSAPHMGGSAGSGIIGASGSAPQSCLQPSPPVPTTRLARLSHRQYDGSIRSLTRLNVTPSTEFSSDSPTGGFDNNADALNVVDRLGRDYRRAAENTSAALANDSSTMAQIAPCQNTSDTSCGGPFVAAFGQLAFRRSLDDDEKARYTALYEKGSSLVAEGSAHARGVRVVVEAMLQSPSFLYRVELNDTPDATGLARLSGNELAARLSFALWNQPPDAELMAAAPGFSDPQGVATQAQRLLADERARPVLEDFHRQWLGTDVYANITRDVVDFPSFTSGIGKALQEESKRFVSSVTFDRGMGLLGLLTDTTSFVNADLAKLYGVQGTFGADFKEVALNPAERAGLLTRVGFLAQNAHAKSSSPILRGAQVLKRIMCFEFPAPPAAASTTPLPPFSDTVRTGRDQVTKLTESANCSGCHHNTINPVGFAFEAYDAAGQFRTSDRGYPLDLAGTLSVGNTTLSLTDGVSASKQIAESLEARACYASNWLRYFYGRLSQDTDACTIDVLANNLTQPSYGVKQLLADLTRTQSFLYRSQEAQ